MWTYKMVKYECLDIFIKKRNAIINGTASAYSIKYSFIYEYFIDLLKLSEVTVVGWQLNGNYFHLTIAYFYAIFGMNRRYNSHMSREKTFWMFHHNNYFDSWSPPTLMDGSQTPHTFYLEMYLFLKWTILFILFPIWSHYTIKSRFQSIFSFL